MLYISRHIGVANYGVVDTDDDVEQTVHRSEIANTVGSLGVAIEGVARRTNASSFLMLPYQMPEYLTPLQAKLNLLQYVDIRTWKSMITLLTWNEEKISNPVTVRLSDFGDSVADCVMSENNCAGIHKITLIIDDKIKYVSDNAFEMDLNGWTVSLTGLDSLGVVFDLRELFNEDIAKSIYKQLDSYAGNFMRFVIDSDERKKRMSAMLADIHAG